jgi:hypothetical protein
MVGINITGSARANGWEPAFREALRDLAGSWTIEVAFRAYLTLTQRIISGKVGLFPYMRMPTR